MARTSKCPAVLAQDITPQTCANIRERRRYVFCRAYELLDILEETSFKQAVKRAWGEARVQCEGE